MPTDGSDRVARFEQLLTGPVGDRLCRMYARYWQPDDLAHYLEEAALYSKDHKSTLSITDSVSTKTCAVCVYYRVPMVSKQEMARSILYNYDHDLHIH